MTDLLMGLKQLPELLERAARDVEGSRAKDDARGRHIIDDYAAVHGSAAEDEVVQRTWNETRQRQREAQELLAQLLTMSDANLTPAGTQPLDIAASPDGVISRGVLNAGF